MKFSIEEFESWMRKYSHLDIIVEVMLSHLSEENILAANAPLMGEFDPDISSGFKVDPRDLFLLEIVPENENPCKNIPIDGPTTVAEYHKRITEDIPYKYDPSVCPTDVFNAPFNDGLPL